jgi:hypothetical protein
MPDVTIDNPTVQIDLNLGESTTVPTGERFRVTIMTDAGGGRTLLNGEQILDSGSGSRRSAIEIDLFGGDTIAVSTGRLRIRGYRVD